MPTARCFEDVRELRTFRRRLLAWYRKNRRQLPWRETRDPYRIWISEIMLQQTRVAAVLDHYRKFLKRFPTVHHLAQASEAEVLAAWSGLGYYRRARMLHRAAKQLVAEHNGQLPTSYERLRRLAGIGRYTASAISSIAFGEAVAVVDGNVERVLNRMRGSDFSAQRLWTAAQQLLDPVTPGDFNQAMMELGATICTPVAPLCSGCPVREHCASENLPVRKSALRQERVRRTASLLLGRRQGMVLLRRRSRKETLMAGMWELPSLRLAPSWPSIMRVRHSITVTDWTVEVFEVSDAQENARQQWIPVSQLGALPLTGLTRKILRKLKLLA